MHVDIEQIDRSPWWPFKDRPKPTDAEIKLAAESLLVTPVVVRRCREHGHSNVLYEIVDNERSWLIAQAAGLHKVPVTIVEFSRADAQEYVSVRHRTEVNKQDIYSNSGMMPKKHASEEDRITRARRYRAEINRLEDGYKAEKVLALTSKRKSGRSPTLSRVARQFGVSPASVKHHLNLLLLPEQIQQAVSEGDLDFSVAKELHGLTEQLAMEVYAQAKSQGLFVRDVRELVKKYKEKRHSIIRKDDPDIRRFEQALSERTGGKAQIKHHRNGHGKLIIDYIDSSHLEELLTKPLDPRNQ